MSITERIKQIIEYKSISVRKFCIEIGVSNGFLDKVKDIGCEKVLKILKTYPDISAEWLISGEGEMLKSMKKEASNNSNSVVDKLLCRLEAQSEELGRLKREIKDLKKNMSTKED